MTPEGGEGVCVQGEGAPPALAQLGWWVVPRAGSSVECLWVAGGRELTAGGPQGHFPQDAGTDASQLWLHLALCLLSPRTGTIWREGPGWPKDTVIPGQGHGGRSHGGWAEKPWLSLSFSLAPRGSWQVSLGHCL